jgi:cell division transport system permease protein
MHERLQPRLPVDGFTALAERLEFEHAPALKRDQPLVPVESAPSRALVGVITILTFLAGLCAGAAELVASSSAQWQSSIAREATVQVRPNPHRDIAADTARVVELARATPGVASVQVISKPEAERMPEPWLGTGLNLSDLPVPRMIVLKLHQGARPDLSPFRQLLAQRVPSASLDDHGAWLSRLSTMANTIVLIAIGLTVLVLAAAALAVAFATHGAMAANREIVDVLHFVGAADGFIAREFQRRFFRLGLRGGLLGGAAALAFTAAVGAVAGSLRASAAGDQIEAMFGSVETGWRGYAAAILVAALVSAIAALVSRLTVKHFLAKTS